MYQFTFLHFPHRLSSAGLIYAHYGMEVISEILSKRNFVVTTDCLHHLFLIVYEGFVEELDAIDNGVPMYPEGKPRYRIGTHLSARVHRLNPEWNATALESTDELFVKAIDMVGKEFTERVVEVHKVNFLLCLFVLIKFGFLGRVCLVACKGGGEKSDSE